MSSGLHGFLTRIIFIPLYIMCFFSSLVAFRIFSLQSVLCRWSMTFLHICFVLILFCFLMVSVFTLLGVFWASWICSSVPVINLGKLLAITSSNIFSVLFFLFYSGIPIMHMLYHLLSPHSSWMFCSLLKLSIWSCMLGIFSINAFNLLLITILSPLSDDLNICVISVSGSIDCFVFLEMCWLLLPFHMPQNFLLKTGHLYRTV